MIQLTHMIPGRDRIMAFRITGPCKMNSLLMRHLAVGFVVTVNKFLKKKKTVEVLYFQTLGRLCDVIVML